MAESIVSVTEGSGKKLHTFARSIGANTVEDEVVVVGDQYLASYIVTTSATSTATANSHLLQIMAGASLNVMVRRIEIYQFAMATAAAMMQIAMYRLTTAGTGGTVVGVPQLDLSDASAGCAAQTLPTVKGTEAASHFYNSSVYMMQTVGASAPYGQPIFLWDAEKLRCKPLRITAGTTNGMAIKNITGVAAGTVMINAWITEQSF